jgi:hypothetical protein
VTAIQELLVFEKRPDPVTLIAIYQFMNGAILLVLGCILALAAAPRSL